MILDKIPMSWLVVGFGGQAMFSCRFLAEPEPLHQLLLGLVALGLLVLTPALSKSDASLARSGDRSKHQQRDRVEPATADSRAHHAWSNVGL